MNDADRTYLLQMKDITKHFPGVLALDNVSFDLKPGEVHVLIGENGAGKSTLIKILAGAYKMDDGELFINGEKNRINDTHHAIQLGIATCYQELTLIPTLSAAENIFLGRFPLRGKNKIPLINKNKVITRTMISEHVWDIHFDAGSNVIDVIINFLRKKIETEGEEKIIHTIRGAGYMIKDNEE